MTTKHKIEAARAAEPSVVRITATAPVEIQAAQGDDEGASKLPTFDIVGYTGAPMNISGFFAPVIIDLAGFRPASEQIPALWNHDTGRIVGQTTTVAIGSDVKLSGVITGENDDAREVATQSKNGFKWRASVGATIVRREFLEAGKKAKVNGREVIGPLNLVREAVLDEISFVAIGADNNTSVNVAASQPLVSLKGALSMNDFEKWLQSKGFSDPAALDDTQRASLQAMYDAEHAGQRTDPAKKQSLDDILAARREEDKRVEEITRITGEAINERPALTDELGRMARSAVEAKSTVPEFELAVLRLRANVAPGAFIPKGDTQATAKVIEAAVCMTGGLDKPEKHFDDRTLQAAHDRFAHGIGLVELLMMAARENGHSVYSGKDTRALLRAAFGDNGTGRIQAQGWSTLSLPGILSNTANKFLTMGFEAVEDTWRMISARRSVRDFKAITSYSLTGGFKYEKVGPGGELKHATVGELSYTNQAETYGRMFAITRQDLINDDLDALTQVPRRLGRGAALALNEVFWTAFMNNATFFTTARANYFEGAATNLQISSLTTGETLFMNQTDPDGYPVAITPRILLVPNALSVTAATLMNSTQLASDTTANTVTFATNPHAGKFRVVQSSYLSNTAITGNSATAWYLLADPADLAVIEVAFLNGKENPTVESAEADFSTLGVQFRGYHDWGCSMQEYRAGVKSKGAA